MQKTMTNKEYQAYVEKKTPNSKTGRNVLRAFLIGGLICTIGQFITNVLKMMGYGQEQVSSIVSLIMIFIGALLTGLDIYDDIGDMQAPVPLCQ